MYEIVLLSQIQKYSGPYVIFAESWMVMHQIRASFTILNLTRPLNPSSAFTTALIASAPFVAKNLKQNNRVLGER